jgi:signal peptidase I
MRRARADDPEEGPEPEEEGNEDPVDEEPELPPRSARHHPSSSGHRRARPSTYADPDDEELPEGVPTTLGWFGPKRPIYWRARDSLWFEPLVALAIVVLLLVGLYAYTENWPPVYVVESDSMQHGSNDVVGLINTGDLVLAQKIDPSSVVTYVVGSQTGYKTYGEYGDVLLYHPYGTPDATPIIHRAIVYLEYIPGGSWSIPTLTSLPCSPFSHPYYYVMENNGEGTCDITDVTGTLTLYAVGWQSATVSIPLTAMGNYSGFVTMGDNNYVPGNPAQGEIDQTYGISTLVNPGWILGVARGMIPWFGSLKLLLDGSSRMVPSQSWGYMGITIAAIILGGLGIHLLFRRRDGTEDEPEEGSPKEGSWIARLLPGHHSDEPEGEEEAPPPPRHKTVSKDELLRRAHATKRGRPKPAVRRAASKKRAPPKAINSEDL